MVKPYRILVTGAKSVGKTSLIHELVYSSYSDSKNNGFEPCVSPEDFYEFEIEYIPDLAGVAGGASGGGAGAGGKQQQFNSTHVKDTVRLIDTEGVREGFGDLPKYFVAKHNSEYINIDGVIILYSLLDLSTFHVATRLYMEFSRKKDSKYCFPIMLLGTKLDLVQNGGGGGGVANGKGGGSGGVGGVGVGGGTIENGGGKRQVSQSDISSWLQQSKAGLHFEISVDDRTYIISCFTHYISKFHVTTKSTFAIPGFRKK